jgi:hypothetical protein
MHIGKYINLKIGRNEYQITSTDTFLDNQSCVQLTSQSKEPFNWGQRATPILSKRAVKEISVFKRLYLQHGYGDNVQLFSLEIEKVGE